jgi:hypothetical protein
VKSGSDMVESSKEGCGSKKGCFANDADLWLFFRCNILSRSMCAYRRGMDWILDLLTQLETARNYNTVAELHALQIIITR